jgi:AcrR family transcriptional regulator
MTRLHTRRLRMIPGRIPMRSRAVTVVHPIATAQRAPAAAKLRILQTANTMFYEDGIRAVGIDRLISSSAVTKATFYKHYGSKDTLIIDYARGRHQSVKEHFERLRDTATDAASALTAVFDDTDAEVSARGFRGCAFLNAAAEFPEPTHPVRVIVHAHRDWMTDFFVELVKEIGHPMPGDAADELMLARDGAMCGGYAGDPIAAAAAFRRTVARIIAEATN